MIWFSEIVPGGYKRTEHYVGSCHTLEEVQLLKKIAMSGYEASRSWYKEWDAQSNSYAGYTWKKEQKKKLYFGIKARGPRNGNYHVTPRANATHFDVYMYERHN